MHNFLGVPVRVEGRVIGNLYLTDKAGGGGFTEEDEHLVESFARHAGLAIHNARMHEELRQLAVLQERERIAQDLHDGSIQSLYAVSLALEDTEELMQIDPIQAVDRIDHAIESIHGTIQEIRDFIMGLDPEARRAVDLLAGLTALTDEFERSTHHEVELVERPGRAPRPRRHHPAHPAHPRGHEQRGPPRERDARSAFMWRIVAMCCACLSSTTGAGSTPRRASGPVTTASPTCTRALSRSAAR